MDIESSLKDIRNASKEYENQLKQLESLTLNLPSDQRAEIEKQIAAMKKAASTSDASALSQVIKNLTKFAQDANSNKP